MHVESFDSLEAMYARMAEQEAAANAALSPDQGAMRDAVGETVYWMRPYEGMFIFGECPSLAAATVKERSYYPILDGARTAENAEEYDEAASEFEYSSTNLAERRSRGYLFGTAYSVIEPDGELGDTHVANAWPISKEAFEQAREVAWQPTPENAPALTPYVLALLTAMRDARR